MKDIAFDSKNHGTVVPPSDTPDTDLPNAWTAWCTIAVTSVRIFTSKSAVEVSLRCSIALLISSEGMGAPNVMLRRAPIRGVKLYGKERPSGMSVSKPVIHIGITVGIAVVELMILPTPHLKRGRMARPS